MHFLAHLSCLAHKVTLLYIHALVSVVIHLPPFSKILSAWLIRAKFHVEPPTEGGTKVCIKDSGHMTKMVATSIYGENLKKSSSTMILKFGM